MLVGVMAGLALGLGVCWAQERFGLVPLSSSVVEYCPVKVLAMDLVLVFGTVMAIGLLAALGAVAGAQQTLVQAGTNADGSDHLYASPSHAQVRARTRRKRTSFTLGRPLR